MSELQKKLEGLNLNVLQAMCTKKYLGISAKSDKTGKKGGKLNLTKEALINEMIKKPAADIEKVYKSLKSDGEDKFIKESESRNESMAPTEAAETAEDTTTDTKQKDIEKFSEKRRANKVINKLKTLVNNTKMTKTQLQERIRLLENEIGARGEHVLAEKWETGDMRHRIKKMVDETTEREEEAKALKAPPKAPPATVAKAAQAPPPTVSKAPPPTPKTSPKTSPTKTDNTRDYKQVKFQGLTKDENSNAKVHVKMAHVQITKSDIEKELERQNNRRFGFQHNKISYNTHWGKQGGKISSELI